MTRTGNAVEHRTASSPDRRASGWSRLATACHEASNSATAAAAVLDAVLEQAVRALGGERGFVVIDSEHPRGEPDVVSAVSLRGDGGISTSSTILRSGLRGDPRDVWVDPREASDLSSGESVQRLGLRSVASTPVPYPGARAAVVVDSRLAGLPHGPDFVEMFDAFGALLAGPLRRLRSTRRRKIDRRSNPSDLVGASRPFKTLLHHVRRCAGCGLPVLVSGESGTGKEGVSRLIHRFGDRADGPFVALNCAAIPETLIESQLFGVVRGTFTGAVRDRDGLFRLAEGGTLLLDEIGDMPGAMQAKLLRVLQDNRVRALGSASETDVDVRIIVASHRDLGSMVADGQFRADLYHRLSVLRISVPPLRERLDDLPILVEHLSSRLSRVAGLPAVRLSAGAMERLTTHAWPGNVRELEAVLARAAIHATGPVVRPEDLEIEPVTERPDGSPTRAIPDDGAPLEVTMIRQALAETGEIASAAFRIGWSRQKLYRRMRVLGIRP